jgi:hypothetical protein
MSDPEVHFIPEQVVDDRVKHGVQYFRVKWVDLPSTEDLWQPEDSFEQLPGGAQLIEEYWERKKQSQESPSPEPSLPSPPLENKASGRETSDSESEADEWQPGDSPEKPQRARVMLTRLRLQKLWFGSSEGEEGISGRRLRARPKDEIQSFVGAKLPPSGGVVVIGQARDGTTVKLPVERAKADYPGPYFRFLEACVGD